MLTNAPHLRKKSAGIRQIALGQRDIFPFKCLQHDTAVSRNVLLLSQAAPGAKTKKERYHPLMYFVAYYIHIFTTINLSFEQLGYSLCRENILLTIYFMNCKNILIHTTSLFICRNVPLGVFDFTLLFLSYFYCGRLVGLLFMTGIRLWFMCIICAHPSG